MSKVVKFKSKSCKETALVNANFNQEVESVTIKRDGSLWLIESGLSLDGVRFYREGNIFCLGWFDGYNRDDLNYLTEKLADFPYDYAIRQL